MKTGETKEEAAVPLEKGKARIAKLQLNKETLTDLNVKSGDNVKGGRCPDTHAQTCTCRC